jgi:ABC-2 type transport system permease protein
MTIILWKTLKAHRWPVLVMSLMLLGLGVLFPTSYSSFGPEGVPDFWETLPKGIAALMKTEGTALAAAGPEGYIAIGLRHPLVLIVLSAFAVATASGALAREVEQRTILILLARPVRRYQLVLARWLESLLGLIVLVAVLLAGIYIGVLAQGLSDQVSVVTLLTAGFNALCLAIAVLGFSYLISARSDDGGRATLLATGLTVAFFFVDFLAGLFESLEPLSLVSIFHYYDPVGLAVDATFPALHVIVLLATGFVTFGAGLVIFERRDIAA